MNLLRQETPVLPVRLGQPRHHPPIGAKHDRAQAVAPQHGFANPDHELLPLWTVSPAGLDGFFRDTRNPPGVPPKQLTREQINGIAPRYATEFG
jgi:hypothetical protein